MVSEALKQQIRDANPLVDLVSEKMALSPEGNWMVGHCPFHREDTPSFKIRNDRYYCFGCGASGDQFEWVMQMENLTFPEAVRYLASKAGIPIDDSANKKQRSLSKMLAVMDIQATRYQQLLEKNMTARNICSVVV